MIKQTFKFLAHERLEEQKIYKHTYSMQPKQGYVWLQRLCFWVLRKIGAFHHGLDIKTSTYEIPKSDSFIEQLYAQNGNLKQFFNYNPRHVLIGGKQYDHIMSKQSDEHHMFSFGAQHFTREGRFYVGTVRDIQVHVVPWIDGVIVLPEELTNELIDHRNPHLASSRLYAGHRHA